MTIKRWAARRDTTERPIVLALLQVGALVLKLDKFDLLVLFRGQLFMLDTKGERGRLTASQEQLLATGWPLHIATTPDDALAIIGVQIR